MKKTILIILAGLVLAGVILLYIYIDSHRPHHFEVDFLDIGQGDSALIKFANGQKMLVDCGPNKIVLSRLGRHLSFYDRTIDYLLATHPDLDHYGGCVDVLQRYNVKNIIVNGHEKTYDPYWKEWDKTMLAEPGANIITMASPTVWMIASDTLQFMSPDPALKLDVAAADSNNYSIVFKLTHGSETFLFTGDMEEPLEKALMGKYCTTSTTANLPVSPSLVRRGDRVSPPVPPQRDAARGGTRGGAAAAVGGGGSAFTCPTLQSNILKIGHHGSDSGTSESFLRLVSPVTAIISAGVKNRYGHPSLRVIRRLERAGAEILRTDEVGDIVVR